jgi:NifU-like protein involved in Fe-S cluster formation
MGATMERKTLGSLKNLPTNVKHTHASELTDEQVADALGGLPAHKYHCSNLAASALQNAIMDYVFKSIR